MSDLGYQTTMLVSLADLLTSLKKWLPRWWCQTSLNWLKKSLNAMLKVKTWNKSIDTRKLGFEMIYHHRRRFLSSVAKKVFVHLAKNGGGARDTWKKQVWFKFQIQLSRSIIRKSLPIASCCWWLKSGEYRQGLYKLFMKATKVNQPQVALKLLAQNCVDLKKLDRQFSPKVGFLI